MTLLTKLIVIAAFSALVVAIVFALPSVEDYPLNSAFTTALTTIFGYLYAWSSVFTAINTLLLCAITGMFIELMIVAWNIASWVLTRLVARMIG